MNAWMRLLPSGMYSGSPLERITFDFASTKSYWLSGTPIISQMILSGMRMETSVTKSHAPIGLMRSRTSTAVFCTSSMRLCMTRGVKLRETMPRNRPWRGSSMLIIEP